MPIPDGKAPNSLPLSEQTRLAEKRRRRSSRLLVVAAVVVVIVPFLFWHGTWFGRVLSDEEVEKYLADNENPRHTQHALVFLSQHIGRGEESVKRWYPQVIHLSRNPFPEVRVTVAWLMGFDNQSDGFHQALLGLLTDPEPLVRRNAALSLVRFDDARGKPEILDMLRPYEVRVPRGGIIRYSVPEGGAIDHGGMLARLEVESQDLLEIHSPLPGRVEKRLVAEGLPVVLGQGIVLLSPSSEHVWEGLRALYLIGATEDFPEVERFIRDQGPDITPEIREQAKLTAGEIRRRSTSAVPGQAPAAATESPRRDAPVR